MPGHLSRPFAVLRGDRADVRAGGTRQHHRQSPPPGRLDQIDLLDARKDESVDQGFVDAPLAIPARDQGQPDAALLAGLGDTGEERVVVLVREEQGDAEITDRHHADG